MPRAVSRARATQVPTLLQHHHGEPDAPALDVVKESLLLLLELARSADLQQELAGGSWIADLVSVTGRIVRNEVHSQLVPLAWPAKILQNAVTRPR